MFKKCGLRLNGGPGTFIRMYASRFEQYLARLLGGGLRTFENDYDVWPERLPVPCSGHRLRHRTPCYAARSLMDIPCILSLISGGITAAMRDARGVRATCHLEPLFTLSFFTRSLRR